jgi:shikimate kinase
LLFVSGMLQMVGGKLSSPKLHATCHLPLATKVIIILAKSTPSNIILTGFMGTGKTTVGRLLAQRLQRPFTDTDDLIVARDGRAVADIFAQDGEAAFRAWERTVALELAQQDGLVIATGGRLMLDEENAAALSASGQVFCLTAVPQTILARVQDDARRPLLNVPNPAERIAFLLEARREGYGRFPQIHTDGKTAEQVTTEIIHTLQALASSNHGTLDE